MFNSSKTWQNSLHFLTLTACPFKALKKIIFGQFYFMKKLYTNLNICILLIFYKKYVYRFICQQLKSDINSSHSLSPECLIRRDVSLYALKIDVYCISYWLTVSIAVVYVKASQQIKCTLRVDSIQVQPNFTLERVRPTFKFHIHFSYPICYRF